MVPLHLIWTGPVTASPADLVLSWIRLWPVVLVVFPRACQKDIVFGVAMG